MKKPKISIIVPVYNVEKYLNKCLDCLVKQTYSNLEIIIVNDCSSDDSERIIKEYEKQYNNIIYIKNENNKGLSFSRNIGLKSATGEYIGYIDSDDYVPYNYYESLINTSLTENADIVVCDINVIYENDNVSNRTICGSKDNKRIDFINNGLAASACNKLFKKKNLEQYEFSVGKINEDIAVVIPAIINAKKVVYNEEVLYNYVQRENSIQNTSVSEKRFDIFYGVEQTLNRIKDCKNYDEYKDVIVFQQLTMLYIYVLPKEKSLLKRAKLFRKFNKLSKKYNIMKNKYLLEFFNSQGRKHKLYYKLLFKLNSLNLSFLASTFVQIINFIKKHCIRNVISKNINLEDIIKLARKQQKMKNANITISVVIPNYNYAKFLYQRIYSVLYQKYKINEIIIVDDCSTDDSRMVIEEIVKKLKGYIDIKSVYNSENSGSAFKQWQKGMNLAKSDYVWIAEADDYCDKRMLKNLVKAIVKNKNVMISYCNTAFVDTNGFVILKSIISEIDIMKTGHWNNSYINNGIDEFKEYSFLNCTIANVSSCIIKKGNYDKEFKISGDYKQAGDWIFYVNIMQKGDVAYFNKAYNYYRVHGNNVSSVTKKQKHFDELLKIHNYYDQVYGLTNDQRKEINKRYSFLKKVWHLD